VCFVRLFRGGENRVAWESFLSVRSGSGGIPAQALAKGSYLLEDFVTLFFVDSNRWRWRGCRLKRPNWGLETHGTDVQIFLETVQLQEVGEFERTDVSALGAYFLLEISDHALEVSGAEASAQELIPEPLAIEAQSESLAGPLAVKLVEFAHRLGPVLLRGGLCHRGEEF
jgi:hypothetical protein